MNEPNPCAKCCQEFIIAPKDLLRPDQMSPHGREFLEAHGLHTPFTVAPFNATRVKILHRCQHLDTENRCGIYDRRPAICRQHDCTQQDGGCTDPRKGIHPASLIYVASR